MAKTEYISPKIAVKSENTNHGLYRHGMWSTREYIAWREAKSRCNNPKHHAYARYGGRGIRMSDEWQADFIAFYRDMGPCNGLTLDRLNNNGNYEKGNCAWRDWKHQNRNNSGNHVVEYKGEQMAFAELAERLGYYYGMFKHFFNRHQHLLIDEIIRQFPLRRRCVRKP